MCWDVVQATWEGSQVRTRAWNGGGGPEHAIVPRRADQASLAALARLKGALRAFDAGYAAGVHGRGASTAWRWLGRALDARRPRRAGFALCLASMPLEVARRAAAADGAARRGDRPRLALGRHCRPSGARTAGGALGAVGRARQVCCVLAMAPSVAEQRRRRALGAPLAELARQAVSRVRVRLVAAGRAGLARRVPKAGCR